MDSVHATPLSLGFGDALRTKLHHPAAPWDVPPGPRVQRKESELAGVRRKLHVKHRPETQRETYWWNPNQPRQDLEYVYIDRDDYEALKDNIDAELAEDGTRYVVRGIYRKGEGRAGRAAKAAQEEKAAEADDKKPRGCYNCLSPDHPSHRCLRNPVEGSPLFMPSAECSHCEQRGHLKSMCKADGGACHGMPGIFPKGASTVSTTPMVVTVAAEATKQDVIPTSPTRRGPNSKHEMKALRSAFGKPKSEFEALQEKLQFSALRQSHDDFLVLFGDRCETYKRRHQTPFYGKEVPEVGFNTPVEASYRPIGEGSRQIILRIKDLNRGFRYPPQTMREAQEKKKKAERDEQKKQQQQQLLHGKAGGGVGAAAAASGDHTAEHAGGKKGGGPGRSARQRLMGGAMRSADQTKVRSGDDDVVPVASQLKKLLELADKKSCSEAADELVRRRERAKEKRREEVREAIESRRQQRREDDRSKNKKQPFTQAMFLQRFAFPKNELKESKHRVDMVKKGETLVAQVDSHDPVTVLFPVPFLKTGENAGRRLLEADEEGEGSDYDGQQQGGAPTESPVHSAQALSHADDMSQPHSLRGGEEGLDLNIAIPHPPDSPYPAGAGAAANSTTGGGDGVACGGLKRPSTAPLHRATPVGGVATPSHAQTPTAQSVGGVPLAAAADGNAAGRPRPIVNWRLKCVEDFDSNAKPPPRVYAGAYEGGGDMEISGFNCNYWSSRFLSEQFRSQIKLQAALARRRQNRRKVYNDAAHLATLSQQAAVKAVPWHANTPMEAATTATSPTVISRSDLWTRAIRDYSQQTIELENKAAFYAKVLFYADLLGSPTTHVALHLLHNLRDMLIQGGDLSRALLERLTATVPQHATSDPEIMKLLSCVRSELGMVFTDF